MLRVVVDTNVFISALLFQGKPARILKLAEDHAFTLIVSTPLCQEVERVLAKKFAWPKTVIDLACVPLWRLAELVTPAVDIEECPDPDDNRILECALEGRADAIVTGDRHLLDMKKFRGIPILAVNEFLRTE